MTETDDEWVNLEWLKEFTPTFGPEWKMYLARAQRDQAIKDLLEE